MAALSQTSHFCITGQIGPDERARIWRINESKGEAGERREERPTLPRELPSRRHWIRRWIGFPG